MSVVQGAAIFECAYCSKLFPSFKAAEKHERARHLGNAEPIRRVNKHRSLTKKCEHCDEVHSIGQCSSHGVGSFARTHGSAPRKRKTSAKRTGTNKEMEKLQRLMLAQQFYSKGLTPSLGKLGKRR